MAFNTVTTARLSPLYFKDGKDTIVPVYILGGFYDNTGTKPMIFFAADSVRATKTTYSDTSGTWWVTPHMSWKNSDYIQLPNYTQIQAYTTPLTDDQKQIVGLTAHDDNKIYHTANIEEELMALKLFYGFIQQKPPDEPGILQKLKTQIAALMAKAPSAVNPFMPVATS